VSESYGEPDLPYFFLAYAHTPEQPWVARFYQELNNQILEHTDWPTDRPAGFMDRSGIRLGAEGQQTIAGALSTCRVFVPLYSRRYFTRPECGREWHAFSGRMLGQRALRGGATAPIVPALWTPVKDQHLPPVARRIQVDFQTVHHAYAEEGLYTLIKNRAYRSTYLRVVRSLAREIISAAEDAPLGSCGAAELDLSTDAFNPDTSLEAWAGWTDGVPANRRLTIMLAVPRTGRLPADRTGDAYGPQAYDWQPFSGEGGQTLAEASVYIARSHDLTPTVLSAEDALELDWSSPDTGLGIVLLDPWLSLDPGSAGLLDRIDDLCAKGRIGAIVVWNSFDQQTVAQTAELRKELHERVPRCLGDPDIPISMGATHVHTLDQFSQVCPTVLDWTFNRYLNRAEATSPGGDSGPLPMLWGPAGDGPAAGRPLPGDPSPPPHDAPPANGTGGRDGH
jgi:FxsC-like protein